MYLFFSYDSLIFLSITFKLYIYSAKKKNWIEGMEALFWYNNVKKMHFCVKNSNVPMIICCLTAVCFQNVFTLSRKNLMKKIKFWVKSAMPKKKKHSLTRHLYFNKCTNMISSGTLEWIRESSLEEIKTSSLEEIWEVFNISVQLELYKNTNFYKNVDEPCKGNIPSVFPMRYCTHIGKNHGLNWRGNTLRLNITYEKKWIRWNT